MATLAALLAVCSRPQDTAADGRPIDLVVELELARAIEDVRIIAYAPDALMVQPLGSKATIGVNYPEIWDRSAILTYWPPQGYWSSVWPPVGADVLIVVDVRGAVWLMGWRDGPWYRFWRPQGRRDIARFICRRPAEMLVGERGSGRSLIENDDGCRMVARALRKKRLQPMGPMTKQRSSP